MFSPWLLHTPCAEHRYSRSGLQHNSGVRLLLIGLQRFCLNTGHGFSRFQTWPVLLSLSWFLSSSSSFPRCCRKCSLVWHTAVFCRWVNRAYSALLEEHPLRSPDSSTRACIRGILWCMPLLRNQATEITSKTLVTVTMVTMKMEINSLESDTDRVHPMMRSSRLWSAVISDFQQVYPSSFRVFHFGNKCKMFTCWLFQMKNTHPCFMTFLCVF